MNNCVTTTQQSTTKPCAYFLGYTVSLSRHIRDTFTLCGADLMEQSGSHKITLTGICRVLLTLQTVPASRKCMRLNCHIRDLKGKPDFLVKINYHHFSLQNFTKNSNPIAIYMGLKKYGVAVLNFACQLPYDKLMENKH